MLNFNTPQIMGIINVTPNSFSPIGRIQDPDLVLRYATKLVAEGADIIDVGAEPTNPGLSPSISLQEELDRLLPILERLRQEIAVPISIDTSKACVMREAIKCGINIINDVRALRCEGTIETVAASTVMVCLMHMSFPEGKSADLPHQTFVPDVITCIKTFLEERIQACETAGIKRERLIIDPGIGAGNFGKNTTDNLKIIKHLNEFKNFKLPILIGVSRKTFIGDILGQPAFARLLGSLAVTAIAVYNGAMIIRTHDVKDTVDVVKIAREIQNVE